MRRLLPILTAVVLFTLVSGAAAPPVHAASPNDLVVNSITYETRAWTNGFVVSSTAQAISGFNAASTASSGYSNRPVPLYSTQNFNNRSVGGTASSNIADHLVISLQNTSAGPLPLSIRLGPDYGYGGTLLLDEAEIQARWTNMWWNGRWDNSGQILTGAVTLAPGSHTLEAYGFEDSNDGPSRAEYSLDGGQTWTVFGTLAAQAGGPYAVDVGGTVALHGSFSAPISGITVSYAWDLDNDGSFETSGQNPTFSAAGRNGPSNQTVVLKVTDSTGLSDTSAAIVNIGNVAPAVTPAGAQNADEGVSTSFSLGSFSDPGSGNPWSVQVDWGDGTSPTAFNAAAAGSLASANHAYADNGTYTVTVQVTDKDGGVGSATFQVAVVNLSPGVAMVGPTTQTVAYGDSMAAVTITATDVAADTLAASTSSLPNGVSLSAGNCQLSGDTLTCQWTVAGKILAAPGSYPISFTVADKDGASARGDFTLTVVKATPVLTWNAPADIVYGTVLGDSQLNAAASVPGSFAYTPPAGTKLEVGSGQTLEVTFTPSDSVDYNSVSGSVVIHVSKADQSITFGPLGDRIYGDAPFAVGATASSGLAVSFAAAGNCTISGSTVTVTRAGRCAVTASQPGDGDFQAASPVSQSFAIARAPATVTLSNLNHVFDGKAKAATATTSPTGLKVAISHGQRGTPVASPTNPGSFDVTATVDDANYQGTATGTLVIANGPTTLALNGATAGDYNDPATLSATLTSSSTTPVLPIAGVTVSFVLGTQSCSGTTDSSGKATCSITPKVAADAYPLTASFAGNDFYLPASAASSFAVNREQATLAIGSSGPLPSGAVKVSAVFKEDGATPIVGRTVTFSAGGASGSGTTDASGIATVTLALAPGQYTLSASFGGDQYYQAAAAAQQTLYAYQPTGFVIWGGNSSGLADAVKAGQSYLFWGAQWYEQVTAGDYLKDASFKGYANKVDGSKWTTDPGNSSGPPSSIPSYIGVIVATQIGKNGDVISGNVAEVVVLKVDNPASYKPDPGSTGSGTVVAILPK